MLRLLLCLSALLGLVPSVLAQVRDDGLPSGAIARLGEVRYRNVGRVFSLAFSPDGKTLLAGAWDGSIRLWDVATGKELRQYAGHKGWVRSVAFAPDGKTFASGGKDKVIRLWETATGKEFRRLEGHQSWIEYLIFSPDGKTLASRDTGRTIRLWEVATGRESRRIVSQLQGARGSLAFSRDGIFLAYGNVPSIVLFDLATGKEARRFTVPHSWFGGLAFSLDDKRLSGVNGNDAMIYSWDTVTGKELRPLGKIEEGLGSIAFSPDGRSMATAGKGHSIHIQEVATRQERCSFQSPDKKSPSLAYSPDGRILAQGSEDITVLQWDVTGLQEKGRLQPAALSSKELQALWVDLARADAATAHRAIWKLTAGAKDSIPFIQEHLRPVAPVDERTTARFVADLDSDRFETRQEATKQLEKLGELAVPVLRKALQPKSPLETRKRVERLLEKVGAEQEEPSPDRLRMRRALEALEHMDTPAARQALEQYTKGAAGAELTEQAKAALQRLARRSKY
ncbi:MAG TPA: WD40 repeat domain-containing protein [Gemmataceae bacterium]|jgi:sugar lactone lactonase YvrE